VWPPADGAQAKAALGGPPVTRAHWAAEHLKVVVESLGVRARNSPLKGIAIFVRPPRHAYCPY
jgi:hypothetical protein